jgi:hypothetical protein
MHFPTIVLSILIASTSAAPIPSWGETKRSIGEIVTDATAAVVSIVNTVGTAGKDVYKTFAGDGTSATGWPSVQQWCV